MERIYGAIAAFVLGLLALAQVTGMGSGAFDWYNNSRLVSNVSSVQTAARGQFMQGSNGYTNFTTANAAALITAGIIPAGWVKGGAIVDNWGNNVTLASASNATIGSITFGGGNTETVQNCGKVVNNLGDYVSVVVGGKTFTQASPPDAVTATAACQVALSITVNFQ